MKRSLSCTRTLGLLLAGLGISIQAQPGWAAQESHLVPLEALSGDEFGSAVALDGDRLVIGGAKSDSAGAPSSLLHFDILMLGNSYTQGVGAASVGGVTEDVQGIFDADSDYTASVTERAQGGWTLLTHLNDPTTRNFIQDSANFTWDIVCLQEQSLRPGVAMKFGGPDRDNLDAGGPALIDLIQLHQPQARIVLYNTWARVPGHPNLVSLFNDDPQEMLTFTNLGYDRIAANPPAWDHSAITSIARVGDAWLNWYGDYSYSNPERVHAGDGTHQNQRGSYLAAAVLFETITGKSTLGNTFAGSYQGGVSGTIGGTSTLTLLQQYATAASSAVRVDTGSALVFERSGGNWSEVSRLSASDAEAFAEFGAAVSIDGDRIAVGSPAAEGGRGAVYVFQRNAMGEWLESAKIVAAGGAPGDRFGSAVSLDGDRIAVGAPERDVVGFQFHAAAGTVYVYSEGGGTWSEEARLEASDAATADGLGTSLALSGDELLTGAPGDDDAGADAGSVYSFNWTGAAWTFRGETLGAGAGDRFGESLDLEGDLGIVGAPGDDAGATDSGSATILELSGGQWSSTATLTPASPGLTNGSGSSVALAGNLALVGTPFDDDAGSDSGSVSLFRRIGSAWPEVGKLNASDASVGDRFGGAVALSSSSALIGSPFDNVAGADSGSAYHVELSELLSEFFSFCVGDGGDGFGCTPCPCGNDAPAGSKGGCLNEAGQSARLLTAGVPAVSSDTLRFTLEGANPNTFAILFSGASRAPTNAANPCFGSDSGVTSPVLNGLRCAVQEVQRHGTRPTDSNGMTGVTTPAWGPPNGPPGGLLAQGGFVAGQTRHFQVIYRETPSVTCVTNQNTSQGLTVVVTP